MIPQIMTPANYKVSNIYILLHFSFYIGHIVWPIVNSRQYLFSKTNWNWNPFNKFQNDKIRQLLNNDLTSSFFYRYLNGSMTNSRMYDSLVRIDRINNTESVFQQTCFQVLSMDPVDLRLPWRAWKV